MLLPTDVNLAIPTNVVIGGPPTISLMGMAFKAGFAALGRFAKAFKKLRRKVFKNMKPGFLKCTILRAEPVNIITGEVSVEQQDFALPGRLPLQWVRTYTSNNRRRGVCGVGWETPADARIEFDGRDGTVMFLHPSAGPALFPSAPRAQGDAHAVLEIWDGALLSDHGHEFRVRTKEDRVYHFPKAGRAQRDEQLQEYVVSRLSDLCGNWLHFTRSDGQLSGIENSTGRRIAVHSEDGLIRQLALVSPAHDAHHVLVQYRYDADDDLIAVDDALGQPYRYAYDTHHMVRHTDRNGLSFYYEYQADWRVAHAWGDGGLYDYRFAYTPPLNETRITDSLGQVSWVKFDERNLPICEIDPLGGMTTYEYDEAGRTTAVVDPDRHRTEYHYDDRGNLLTLTRPDGKAIVTAFDAANKATRITDPNGATWQQEWDARGLLTKQITPLGAESIYEYDAVGQLVGFINPLKARTALAFDGAGHLSRLTDALGHSTTFAYDLLGNVTAKTDPLGQTTRYRYDAKGRLIAAQLPSGATLACGYDPEDNLTRYVDENGAETRLDYCGQGEIKRRIQPDGYTVDYHYDTEERLIGVTNQRGETYHLRRDPLGRIVEEVDYWGQSRHYRYTACGYLIESADPLGRLIHYRTDPLGRIVEKTLPDPAGGDRPFAERFDYDANGNLTACANPHIRIERRFDPEGRLLEERQGQDCSVANTYDANGNRLARTTTREILGRRHSHTVRYGYDLLDQAIRIETRAQAPIELTRNALGQLTQERLSASVRRQLDYHADGHLAAQRVLAAEGPVFDQHYRYDHAGNLIEKRDSALGIDQYTYDPLGRLTGHLDPQQKLTRYFNDPAGDRLRTRVREPISEPGQEPDWRRDGEYDGNYYRYDCAGNLTRRQGPHGELHLLWDANQRLIESRRDGLPTTYQYDPLGRRLCKQTAGTTTRFCWDGDALLGDTVINTKDAGSSMRALREWIYYPETFEPLALMQGYGALPGDEPVAPELYLYHNDPNGCPTRLLDTDGKVVWAAQYSAWGKVGRLHVDRVDNPIRLQGQYYDPETGMHYNRHRYYEPIIGQFVSKDPIGLAGGLNR